VLLPLVGTTWRALLDRPEPLGGVTLDGDGLAMGAMTLSDDGDWVVLRCVNLTDAAVDGGWTFDAPPREARWSRLDETPGEALAVTGGEVRFRAQAREIVTVLVR
jgi:hypothetical protein